MITLTAILIALMVIGIALISWLVLSITESDPAPLLLIFTLFAFAGQCILTGDAIRSGNPDRMILVLLIPATILLIVQVFTVRAQTEKTFEHYKELLQKYRIGSLSSAQIEHWAAVLVRITGVDFFPEFYMTFLKDREQGPLRRRRMQAVSILPPDKFECGPDGIRPDELLVPQDDREFLWRLYVLICMLSWFVFLASILVAARHQ